jgi:pilus assembly protein Flp/PilA
LPMRKLFTRNKDRGASAVEYGLMVALIAAVIVTIVGLLGGGIQTAFDKVCDKVVTGGCTP